MIILGEDLTKFRDVSKSLYGFLRGFTWSQKVERLGFDEVGCLVDKWVQDVDGVVRCFWMSRI